MVVYRVTQTSGDAASAITLRDHASNLLNGRDRDGPVHASVRLPPNRLVCVSEQSSCETMVVVSPAKGLEPMRSLPMVVAIASLSLLAACGHKEPERAEGGAATGAATGATVGLVGGPVGVLAGGAIGGVAGAATGAATKPNDVNLGNPPWHDNTQTGQKAAQHMSN
jgi:hypothetical protein